MKYTIQCACARPHTLFKAATTGPLIDRDRPAIRRQRMKLRIAVKKFLKAQAPKIIAQVLRARDDLAKSRSDVDRILAALNFDDWTVLSGDVDAIIEKILSDAGAQALAQVSVSDAKITELVNDRAVEYAKERSAELVTRISESTREMLRADVAEAMQEGYSNDDLADTLADNYGFSGDRAEVIARTETAYADVAGNMSAYRASGVVARKKWITGEGCCDLCDELNGEIIDLDDTFPTDDGDIDGPPYHPNCFISGTEVAAFGVTAQFARRFTGMVAVIGVAGMNEITVTPNHPILTRRGWVAAGQLQVGDDVVQCLNPVVAFSGVRQPQDNHIETTIEQVAGALGMAGGVAAGTMPVAAIDFHGDGIADTKVSVIRANGALPNDRAELFDVHKDNALAIGHGARALFDSDGPSAAFIEGDDSATPCGVGLCSDGGLLSIASSCHSQQHGAGAITDGKPHPLPPIAQGGTVATDSPGYIHARLAGHVAFVKVENLRFVEYDGHVYNLETGVGWYVAGGIIAHNCRCDVVPVLDDEVDDGE